MRNMLGVVVVAVALAGPGASLARDKAPAAGNQATPKEGETLTVKKGETKTLTFPSLVRVAVGDPEIADITTAGSGSLLVKGGSPGKTTLLVWTADKQRKSYLIEVK